MDIKVNYVGITRRIIASVIDRFIVGGISQVCFSPMIAPLLNRSVIAEDYIELSIVLVLSFFIIVLVILETLMITRFSGTPGQLLCGIYVKDANTLKNVGTTQSAIRCVFRDVVTAIILLWIKHISGWFVILLVLILIFAIFDKRKQFFHDKIARTVAIDYKPIS